VRPSARSMRLRGGVVTALVAGVLAVPLLTGNPAEAATARWRSVPVPVPGGVTSTLESAAPDGANSAWAVGSTAPADAVAGRTPLALHWAGDRWVNTAVPGASTGPFGEREQSIAADGPSNTWMLGSDDVGTVVRRWDGSAWRLVPTGLTGTDDNPFEGAVVAAAGGRAWLAGSANFNGEIRGRVAAWDGSRWSYLPEIGFQYGYLSDIDASGPRNVWTVGNYDRPYVYQWNGSAWVDRLPGRSNLYVLNVEVVGPGDVWVKGEELPEGTSEWVQVLLHWNGHTWTEQRAPGEAAEAGGMAVDPDGSVWTVAVGDRPDRASYLHWSGGTVTKENGPVRRNTFNTTVNGLISVPGRAQPLAVGSYQALGSPVTAMTEARVVGAAS
jgi:hypothetical protein